MKDALSHPEYRGLVADVIAAPADDRPRALIADWLTDQGRHDHAAFIRWQLGEHRWPRPRIKYRQWFAPWWVGPSVCHFRTPRHALNRYIHLLRVGKGDSFGVERGFPWIARTTTDVWLSEGKHLVKRWPLTRIDIAGAMPYWASDDTHRWSYGPPLDREHLLHPTLYQALPFTLEIDGFKVYASRQAAMDALSTACLSWAKEAT